ncbi:MAG: outer membrane lipoprotein chaperone LolA [Gammaproteobacteria bacterium]
MRTGLLAALLLWTSALPADDGTAALVAWLDGLESFAADFEQARYDEDGELVERSRGRCEVERPGRFRWRYAEPWPQTIVSDGASVWVYDPDLEQVTVNAVGEVATDGAAALLGGEARVHEHYEVSPLPPRDDGRAWFALARRDADGDFGAIELGFADGNVVAMSLSDNLGQRTVLGFDDIRVNEDIDDAVFDFTPPAGVDVIRGGGP